MWCSQLEASRRTFVPGRSFGLCGVALLLLGAISAPAYAQSVTFAGVQFTMPASGLSNPNGVAVDGAGNVFIADDFNNRVVKVTPSGVQTTVGSGLTNPDGVAVDGAGDVFIADYGNSRVVEVTPGGAQTTVAGTGPLPTGVAVDGAGDVFTAAFAWQEVVETPAGCTSSACVIAVWGGNIGTTALFPLGVAVDKAGNLFIPVEGTSSGVIKVTPPYDGVWSYIGSGLNSPTGVAVDAAGDVFIADTGNNRVVELPVSGAQTTVGSGLSNPNGVAVDAAGDVFISEGSANQVVKVQHEAVNFGSVNVCPAGQSSPAPCNQTLPLTYNVVATTTFGTTKVVTQGAPNLDFKLSSGSTCTGTVSAGSTCAVNVTFAPLAPGIRMGAVQLTDNLGNVLVTTLVYGQGQGPAVAFYPSVQTTVPISGLDGQGEPFGLAVDGAGDVFIAETHESQVVELPAGCTSAACQTTVGSGLLDPEGLAVDGAGDVFIADGVRGVLQVPYLGNGHYGAQITVPVSVFGFQPDAVAVDGAGNVFTVGFGGPSLGEVEEVPYLGNGNYGTQITVNTGAYMLVYPTGVAVDGTGDVFIADTQNNRVVEVPAVGAPHTIGSGLVEPNYVAVDGTGNVYIADDAHNQVVEVPAGGGAQTTVQLASGGSFALAVAVDLAGDVFIADVDNPGGNNVVVEVQRSLPPTLNFAATLVNKKSSAQSVTIQNIGNQPLDAVSPGLAVIGPNFLQVAGSGKPADCTSSFALAPGATCKLSISFEPQSAGSLTSSATFTDNALNTEPSAEQSITLKGTGNPLTQTVSFTGAPASAADGSTFTVVATSNSDITPAISATGSCKAGPVYASGASFDALVTMTKSTGTCSLKAEWPANDVYKAASATQKTTAE
jgi:hypothetical protein